MTERPSMPQIPVPADVAAAAAMPSDLDAGNLADYTVPDPARRHRAAAVYWIAAAVTAGGILAGLPRPMWIAAAGFVAIAGYHHLAGWHLAVREEAALEAANRAAAFPIGHASATVGFDGWRARPVWNVLVFSADEPPTSRGLVRVDATTGDVIGTYVEEITAVGEKP
ncbi:MAG: PepSY domain-containing protein [Acidimicrobiia bacterium]|jgi:hypothetical protein